ncbi:MAG TPA: isoleucine--tRNA ligase [Acidimicrobiia bacterium]|nr:isoleucine--tRNA ligase [Acidimicrobiia bacterium]
MLFRSYLLIWTTTPWTLPGNLAVAVGLEHQYARVASGGDHYWVAGERVEDIFGGDALVVATAAGSELVGAGYEPPFAHFASLREKGAFRIIASDEVTVDEGTGLVHMAPAYGEVDFLALQEAGMDLLVDPVDSRGDFTHEVPEVAGMNIKEADAVLIRLLKESGKLVKHERITHSYPFCYRTDTPLIYKAIPTWFVAVERFRNRMVEINETIHWVPDHVGKRRFGNWLANARDWAISRNRYWGSCIPVWECDECEEQVAVGSLDELEALSGQRPDDLHKHVVDEITWDCSSCGGVMVRVPEVLDCWFESGSMPYGKLHYPFENKARFEATFPAQFIAEGLDQTRGWFYTLIVLSTALFDQPAFENCVVNGLILAEDGRKMSKSLKNYPDPSVIFDEYGADALRAFLINSPVLRAEPLRFSKDGVAEVVRTVLLPLWNTYSFFTTYAEADGITMDDLAAAASPEERPEMDRWILSMLQSLINEVKVQMEGYYLYNVVPPTLGFIDHLTNWYVRRSRRRFWRTRGESGEGDADKLAAFATLYEVLTTFIEVLAPVLPFITEHLYQDLVARNDPEAPVSIHHRDFPFTDPDLIDADLEGAMATIREVVRLGRNLRKSQRLRVRQPLARLTVLTGDGRVADAVNAHAAVIAEELNVKEVVVSPDEGKLVRLSAKANFRSLGPTLGRRMGEVAAAIAALEHDDVVKLVEGGTVEVAGEGIGLEDVVVERTPIEGTVVEAGPAFACALDTTITDELRMEGLAREIVSRIQNLRREAGLEVSDRIRLLWHTEDEDLAEAIEAHQAHIGAETLATEVTRSLQPTGQKAQVDHSTVWLEIRRV